MPFQRFELRTELPPDLVNERIARVTRTPPRFLEFFYRRGFKGNGEPDPVFFGETNRYGFELRRNNFSNRKGFLPRIFGKAERAGDVTRVRVTVVVGFATGCFLVASSLMFLLMLTASPPEWKALAFLGGLFVLCLVVFFVEARKARLSLEKLLGPEGETRA